MKESIHIPQPLLAEHLLIGRPGPHYLTGEITIDHDLRGLDATAQFPITDPSIAGRGHVNIAHYLFGIWNGSHILIAQNGFDSALSTGGTWKTPKFARPDIPMRLRVGILDMDVRERVATGVIEATYRIGDEEYAKFTSDFFARR